MCPDPKKNNAENINNSQHNLLDSSITQKERSYILIRSELATKVNAFSDLHSSLGHQTG